MQKKATIDAKAFSEGLDQVSKALQKSSYPALSEVSVRVEDGVCILTATDLDTWLIKRIPAQGDDLAFVFTRTREVAKACRLFDGNLVLELEEISSEKNKEWRLFMRCGSRAAQFDVMDPEMYPVYPSFEAESSFSVNAAALYARLSGSAMPLWTRHPTRAKPYQHPVLRAPMCLPWMGTRWPATRTRLSSSLNLSRQARGPFPI